MSTQTQTLQTNRGGKRAKKMPNHSEVKDNAVAVKCEDEEYAKVIKSLGNCRFSVMCYDGTERIGILRGKICRGKGKFNNLVCQDDYVLVNLTAYEDKKCEIISKYSPEHVRLLIKMGELPTGTDVVKRINEDDADETGFDFDDI